MFRFNIGKAFAIFVLLSMFPGCGDKTTDRKVDVSNSPSAGKWQIDTHQGKIEPSKAIIGLKAESGSSVLVIRCTSGNSQPEVIFTTPFVHGEQTIKYSVNSGAIKTSSATANMGNDGLVISYGWNFIEDDLLGKTNLVISFVPYQKSAAELEFNISGIDEAIKTIKSMGCMK